ncbi:phosphate acetyltransferase [Sulfurovum sp.]|uniref:phosphate acetyltransferase n=1 Tax=Sulfurovum sp. TaxID=1969726 RepID=UPI0025F88888|nr:phosphate acetyltransferase [Sulfurovum sp.]
MYLESIYIAPLQPRAGSLIVAMGLMEMLKARYERVAFFCPILPDEGEQNDIHLILQHFEMNMTYEQCSGFTASTYVQAHANGTSDMLYETLIDKVSQLKKSYDFVLIEGYPRSHFASTLEFDLNLEIAKNLKSAFTPVINAKHKSLDEIISEIHLITEAVHSEGCTHLATFVNRCNEPILNDLKKRFKNEENELVYLLPENTELNTPTLQLVRDHLKAKMILGNPEQLQHLVKGKKIAAMGAENYLTHIDNGDIVIVPGDRIDIITASLISFYAKTHPNIAGMILSGGIVPGKPVLDLLRDFSEIVVPIFSVGLDSYQTAIALEKVPVKITLESTRKITLAKGIFDAAVDKERINKRLHSSTSDIMTPMMFEYRLFEQAREKRKKIILPESTDERILRATEILLNRNIVDIILLGDKSIIEYKARQLDINITKASIVDPKDPVLLESFSKAFYEIRRSKGLTLQTAKDAMDDINYFATMMVYFGMADGMVSGATHTTAETIRPALQIIKTKPGISVVSSVFFMCLDTKVLVYGDCALNLDPDAEALAQIAISSAETAMHFGIEPRVAMLSYSTGSSGSGPEVEKVRKATHIVQTLRPDILVEGPIQYDAAIDIHVADKKIPKSKVAGRATVFIFPDLNTGNNTYKAVQRSTGALAIGPIFQGLRMPINDLSRGCLVNDIVNTIAVTAIQAQEENE